MNGWDINDRGQIVGTGYHNGKSCVFVLTVGSTPDTQGPGTYGVKVTPWRTNAAPKITATINDRAKGGNKIIAAEYFLDPKQTKNGKGIPLDGDFDSPAETVSAVLDAAKFRSLGQGTHRILVHGKDAAGNWGSLVAASFVKDTLGPLTAAVEVSPRQARKAPTLTAVIDDGSKGASKIVAAEYFLDDMPQTAGTGIAMTAGDKQFNEPKENVWAVLTAEAFAGLTTGSHTVYVHGKDAAGNWGRVQAATFVKAATRATPSAVAAASSLDELASSARVNGAAILAFLVDSSAEEREDGQ
jgi:hypothetical protein